MSELPELVKALLNPHIYPDPTRRVELLQTQMSFIFLTDEYAYKTKKPVNLGYLDYTTLDKRRFFCQKEVELNRRLCPDTYLDVIPIARQEGIFSIGGEGEVAEYAVKMRRLPSDATLDVLLVKNQVSLPMLTSVAAKIAEFHRKAETSASITKFGDIDTITGNTRENFDQTKKYIGNIISDKTFQRIKAYTENFIDNNVPLFRQRMAEGRIRDCHGDLHAAHICFNNDICIFDCIEFNDRFRYADVASEVAFLAMDLDRYGRADLSSHFASAYVEQSRDKGLLALLNFYKCYRAYVRGKVGCFKYADPYVTEEEKTKVLAEAKSYFEMAESYI